MDRWLSIPEACAIIGISERTARTYARLTGFLDRDRRIPVIRIGRLYRVPARTLEDFDSKRPAITGRGSRGSTMSQTE